MSNDKYLLLGSSRGLGNKFAEILAQKAVSNVNVARKNLSNSMENFNSIDLSDLNNTDQVCDLIKTEEITRIIYFAGGGPYGEYEKKEFKDHQWAFNLNFLFPAKLIHELLSSDYKISQFVFVGSAIAESGGDENAASYCAAKHAIKGLFDSLKLEKKNIDIRLFSPGYMDTDMLPKKAKVRSENQPISSPAGVAKELYSWLQKEDLSGYLSP